MVTGHEPLIDGLHLRDPDDRPVLAAAIKSGAQVIVTADRDFTEEDLAEWNIEAKHPDDFVLDQIDINDRVVWACVQEIANSRTQHPETVDDVLNQLERCPGRCRVIVRCRRQNGLAGISSRPGRCGTAC
jgi:hypothetical protein